MDNEELEPTVIDSGEETLPQDYTEDLNQITETLEEILLFLQEKEQAEQAEKELLKQQEIEEKEQQAIAQANFEEVSTESNQTQQEMMEEIITYLQTIDNQSLTSSETLVEMDRKAKTYKDAFKEDAEVYLLVGIGLVIIVAGVKAFTKEILKW